MRNLELTPEGERLHRLLLVAMREFEKRVFDGVSEKQRNDLRAALDRISANLS